MKRADVKRYIRESIEYRLMNDGYVINNTHQYDMIAMIHKLLGTRKDQSASSIMRLEDWIIDQYSEAFKEARKGSTRKYLIISEDETVVFEILVNHEKLPFDEINKELQNEGYPGIKPQQQ